MRFEDHWEVVKQLGEGGQGKVFLARDRRAPATVVARKAVIDAVRDMNRATVPKEGFQEEAFDRFLGAMRGLLIEANDTGNVAAVKVLHAPEDARDPGRARDRIRREMEAMARASHPNLLRVREVDPDGGWFAADYHPSGTLAHCPERFRADLPGALKALRGVIAGVAKLHAEGVVHRDIKPQNIFASATGDLTLGDFGLVFFADGRTRLSATLESVGSADWMPPWALGARIDEVKPTCDVFSLGKVFWSMVSGKPFLRLWYWAKEGSRLEKLFPRAPFIDFARRLLAKCVVEDERDCLPDAGSLLAEVDKTLDIIARNGDVIGDGVERYCRVCGVGPYELATPGEIDNSGFHRPAGVRALKVFTCRHCGHVQAFLFPDASKPPPAWAE